MPGYLLNNSWPNANRRLALLAQLLDAGTRRRLTTLGVAPGQCCLEVGAGGGSIARWLCDQVGSTGRVVATDINTAMLDDLDLPNLEVQAHDISTDPLPPDTFDFIHVRWLLHHLPEPERVIRRMIDALRPGAWLLIEEVDFFPVHLSASPLFREFMVTLVNTIVESSERDCFWARVLPETIASIGLTHVDAEGEFPVIHGDSPAAEFFALTAEQMRERMLSSSALTPDQINAALRLLKSPDFWAFGGATIAVWGQKPD